MNRVLQAGGLVFKSENGLPLVLLVRAKKDPSRWVFPKGHIERGETPAEAAVREVEEEAGVKGIALTAIEPMLEFQSGDEPVRVQYHLIVATGAGTPAERRETAWVPVLEAFERLSFDDARDLLRRALPMIQPAIVHDGADKGDVKAFQALLEAEYSHTAESLLRNEEDGEKRVSFLITISGGVATALGLILGKEKILQADHPEPAVLATLLVLVGLGYLTLLRVITRNAASDRFKRALNRIRKYFVPSADDPRLRFLSFDPYRHKRRDPLTYLSFGTGGWLPTVAFVDALLLGALAAVISSTGDWRVNAAVGVLAIAVAWVSLVDFANREYARAARKHGDDIVPQQKVFSGKSAAKRFLQREGFTERENLGAWGTTDQMVCVVEGSLDFRFPTLIESLTLDEGDALFVPRVISEAVLSEEGARYLIGVPRPR